IARGSSSTDPRIRAADARRPRLHNSVSGTSDRSTVIRSITECYPCAAIHSHERPTHRRLPSSEPDPIALLADARLHLIDAHEQLQAAVIRARQHHTTWAAIARLLGTTRQAAQQRFTRP